MAAVPHTATAAATEAFDRHMTARHAAVVHQGEIERRRATGRKLRRQQGVIYLRKKNRRLSQAFEGLNSIKALGASPEVQSLISAVQGITLWGGNLKLPGVAECGPMEASFGLVLTEHGIYLFDRTWNDNKEDESRRTLLFYSYEGDLLLQRFHLMNLATTTTCNPLEETSSFESVKGDGGDPLLILFQVLVDCADPAKLERYFLTAIH